MGSQYRFHRPDAHYKQMNLQFLAEFGTATRKDIDSLIIDKLSDALTAQQKRKRVSNLITPWLTETIPSRTGARTKSLNGFKFLSNLWLRETAQRH